MSLGNNKTKKPMKTKYKYISSFQAKEEPYLLYFQKQIQPLCIKFIENKNSLTKKEKETMFLEIEKVKKYIKQWIMYEIKTNYNSKSKIEQKLELLYYKLKNIFTKVENYSFNSFFEESLEFFIEESIFEAIGITDNKEKVFKFSEKKFSNILYWIHSLVFYKILNFLENEILKFSTQNQNINKKINKEIEIETKLDNEKWTKIVEEICSDDDLILFIPVDIQEIVKKFLLSIKIKEFSLTEKEEEKIYPYIDILKKILQKKKDFYEEILFF